MVQEIRFCDSSTKQSSSAGRRCSKDSASISRPCEDFLIWTFSDFPNFHFIMKMKRPVKGNWISPVSLLKGCEEECSEGEEDEALTKLKWKFLLCQPLGTQVTSFFGKFCLCKMQSENLLIHPSSTEFGRSLPCRVSTLPAVREWKVIKDSKRFTLIYHSHYHFNSNFMPPSSSPFSWGLCTFLAHHHHHYHHHDFLLSQNNFNQNLHNFTNSVFQNLELAAAAFPLPTHAGMTFFAFQFFKSKLFLVVGKKLKRRNNRMRSSLRVVKCQTKSLTFDHIVTWFTFNLTFSLSLSITIWNWSLHFGESKNANIVGRYK